MIMLNLTILVVPGQAPSVSQLRLVHVTQLVPGDEFVIEFDPEKAKKKEPFSFFCAGRDRRRLIVQSGLAECS